eukprot:m.242908 g.242908  ORF g.242908 m.242908 type:complete len:66 (-) comp17139_c0_seq4:738-935(-)
MLQTTRDITEWLALLLLSSPFCCIAPPAAPRARDIVCIFPPSSWPHLTSAHPRDEQVGMRVHMHE